MGSRDRTTRLRSGVHQETPSLLGYPMDPISVFQDGCHPRGGNRIPPIQGCHRGGVSKRQPWGVLFKLVRSPQERRLFQTSHKPEASELLHQSPSLQDGDAKVSHSLSKTGGMVSINRLKRCIPTHPHPSKPPQIPQVCVQGGLLPMDGPSIRSQYSPFGLHQGSGDNYGDPPPKGDIHISIPRRYHSQGESVHHIGSSHTSIYRRAALRRLCYQRHQVRAYTNARSYLRWGTVSYRPRFGYIARGSLPSSSKGTGTLQTRSLRTSHGIPTSPRPHGKYVGGNTMGAVLHASSSELLEGTLATGCRSPVPSDSYIQGSTQLPTLVDKKEEYFQGCTPGTTKARLHSHDRRIESRLGSSPTRPLHSGPMDQTRSPSPHQSPRAQGHLSGPKDVRGEASRQSSSMSMRQHYGLCLHSKDGGDALHSSAESSPGTFNLVHTEERSPSGSVSTRGGQYTGRSPESDRRRSQGMVPTSTAGESIIPAVGETIHRSVCVQTECQAPQLLFSLSGRDFGIPSGWVSGVMEHTQSVCIPTQGSNTSDLTQGESRSDTLHAAYSSSVDQENMVSHTSGPSLPRASLAPTPESVPGPSLSTGPGTTTQTPKSRPTVSGGLANHRQSLENQGFSSEVVATMLARRGDSTYSRYGECWKAFNGWCESRGADPFSASQMVILEFLQSLLDSGRATNTLKVYSSAILAFHFGINGIPVGRLPSVSRFLAGAVRIWPNPVVLPSWSLQPVLDSLTKYPWEPMEQADIKHVTLKTIFLLAVTSARRVSELNALCLDKGCYRLITPDILLLRTNVDFMPKCKTEFHRSQEIQLNSFYAKPKTPDEKRLHRMCPIRALQVYVDRTKESRKSNQLFVSFKKGSQGFPISKKRISSWIVETIRTCYLQEGLPPPKNVRAHGTRAQASSWAAFAGVDPMRICRAAVWSNLHTFFKH